MNIEDVEFYFQSLIRKVLGWRGLIPAINLSLPDVRTHQSWLERRMFRASTTRHVCRHPLCFFEIFNEHCVAVGAEWQGGLE